MLETLEGKADRPGDTFPQSGALCTQEGVWCGVILLGARHLLPFGVRRAESSDSSL